MRPGSTRALVVLDAAGVRYVLRSYEHVQSNTHYGDEAATQLGVAPDLVLKTLLVQTPGGLVVVVLSVVSRLDLKAVADVLGVKQALVADPRVAERATGYLVGGISPFGQKKILPTLVDAAASLLPTVIVSAGKRGLAVEMAAEDLISMTDANVAPVARE